MENKKIIGIYVLLLFLVLCGGIFSYFKITYSYFGENLTGQLGTLRSINYYSNYPSDVSVVSRDYEDLGKLNSQYNIKNIMFEIPYKYEFSHWNTKSDNSGVKYNLNDIFTLTDNINLYAIWKKLPSYGDINLDGVVNIDDSTLLAKYIKDNTPLISVLLSNSDVNLDGNIDDVDVDIIKQATLGTKGYEGLLLNKPVLVYDIYEGTINNVGNNSSNNGGGTSGNGKPSNNTDSSSNNGGNTINNDNIDMNENNSSNNMEEEKEDIVDNSNNIEQEKKNNKSYAWIFIVVILLTTLRFVVLIIRKIIKIKNEGNGCDN